MRTRWAVFISGRGSNAQSVFDLLDEAQVRLVVASQKNIWGLKRAQRAGIPTVVLDKKIDWPNLDSELRRRGIDRIFLLGFMKIIPADFLTGWQDKVYNLHPSLLPDYPGIHSIQRSFEDKKPMGVTVHDVIPEMDAGPRRLQKRSLAQPALWDWDSAQIFISRDEQRCVREWMNRRSLLC